MKLPVRIGFVGIAAAVSACGGSGPAAPQPGTTSGGEAGAAAPGADIEALFARENDRWNAYAVSTPDGTIRARIEASAPPTVSSENGFAFMETRLADEPLQCLLGSERRNGAEFVRVFSDDLLDAVQARERRWIDVHGDQSGGWPYAVVRAQYRAERPSGKVVGDLKIAVAVRDQTTIACMMNGLGYVASFERFFRSLLSAIDSAPNRRIARPQYAEIVRGSIAGRHAALTRRTLSREGERTIERSWAMELSIDTSGALRTTDRESTESWQDGRVVGGTYVKASEGKTDHRLKLSTDGDRYRVEGSVGDEPLGSEFMVPGGLPDGDRWKAVVCKVRDGTEASAELADYEPAVDPRQPSVTRIEKAAAAAAYLRATVGGLRPVQADLYVDADCDLERGNLVGGPVALTIERLWHEEQPRPASP